MESEVTVKRLADEIGMRPRDVISVLLKHGTFATVNQTLDPDLVAQLRPQLEEAKESFARIKQGSYEAVNPRYVYHPRGKCPRCGYGYLRPPRRRGVGPATMLTVLS